MEKVMWDMLQADRYVNLYIMAKKEDSPAIKQQKAAEFYEQVFRINDVTRDEFIKSYKFYLGRPDLSKIMFDSISSRADRMRNDLYKSTTPRGRSLLGRRDSLLRVDSLRRVDSIEKAELSRPSTEDLFRDPVLDK
jgi:hypothetical protein